jgi:hypothetical protein
MKYFLFIILSFTSCIPKCFCQVKQEANIFNELKKEFIELKSRLKEENIVFSFSGINVMDKRNDTSCLGYFRFNNQFKNNVKLATKNFLSADLEKYLNDLNKNSYTSNKPSLLLVIKKFWFDRDYFFGTSNYNKHTSYFFSVAIDYFVMTQNEFIPLAKIDTLLTFPIKLSDPKKGILVGEAIQRILKNIPELSITNVSEKKALTLSQLNAYYQKNYDLPIFNSPSLQKGVYMSFSEFKNNAPSISDFEIRNSPLADDIFIKEGTEFNRNSKAWGYCDGTNSFIKIDKSLFQLYRQGFTYSVYGNTSLTHSFSSGTYSYNEYASAGTNIAMAAIGILSSHDNFKLKLVPLQINMETGAPY